VTVYRNQVQDFIYLNQPRDSIVLTIRGPFPAYFYQQDDAVLQGADASFSVNLTAQLTAESRISLLRGYRLAYRDGEKSTYHDWLPLMPTDRYQYGLRYTVHGARQKGESGKGETFVRLVATTALRQTRIPEEGLTKAAPPTFTTFGLDAAHTFRWKTRQAERLLEVGLNIQNLSNVRYREYLDFFRYYADSPGTNVGLRAKLTFGS